MAIDARLRARRVAVRRAEGRRRLRFLFAAVALVTLVIGAWAASRSALLDLDHVRIDGADDGGHAEVVSVVGLERGTPLFDLDLGNVESTVEELAWVAGATVTREWPGTVRVTIEPRVPVAAVGTDGDGRILVDADGVLTGPAPPNSDLPVIAVEPTGALGDVEPAAIDGIAVAVAIPDDLLAWVEAVTVAGASDDEGRPIVGLDLVGAPLVRLGTVDLIDDKLAALRAILGQADLACVVEIDVAVADLSTVTRDPVCEGTVGETEPIDGG